MKIINAQVDVLKEVYKKNKNLVYGTMGDSIVYGDAHRLYITPKELVGINLYHFVDVKYFTEDNLKRLLYDKECEEVTLTNEIVIADKVNSKFKGKLRVFKVNDEQIYVDEKLLKNFDLESDVVTFKGKKWNSPIFIYENDVMVGLVCPVRYR